MTKIIENLIFSSVFVEGEAQGIKNPSYSLKAASFKLILMLVHRSPKLMVDFLENCFCKLTNKFKRR
jgi:hypothetical protein